MVSQAAVRVPLPVQQPLITCIRP